MKAHGISGNNGAARAGSAGPSEPSTPANRKSLPTSRTSTNKKRKLAARGDDIDDQVKSEVKTEVKQETATSNPSDDSYMMHPNDPSEIATSTLKSEDHFGDDESLSVAESRPELGQAAPMAFIRQIHLPTAPDGFYGFVEPASDMHLLSPTSHPFSHGHDADYPTQMMRPTEPAMGHWLQHHQNAFF